MLSKSHSLSYSFTVMDEEAKTGEKQQGIVSILGVGSDSEKISICPSLRRTLSADMSSKKWLLAQPQNGFSSLKKISSSHELLAPIGDSDSSSTSSDNDHEEDYEEMKDLDEKERLEIWNSIQEAKMMEGRDREKANEFTSWASILSQKGEEEDSKSLPPPYVHPLVKRSASTLSDKSLEICTESLGSETGSDGFSSYPPSEVEDAEEVKVEENLPERAKQTLDHEKEYGLPPVKYSHHLSSKNATQPRTFPPPLPSLSREHGTSLSIRSSRVNGRLVLEAVSVSSQKNFQAQRHRGRLILTFVSPTSTLPQEVDDVETVEREKKPPAMELDEESDVSSEKREDEENGNEEEIEELEEAEEGGEALELDSLSGTMETRLSVEEASNMPGGVMNLQKLALMMNKPIGLPNRNPKWASKFNEAVNKHIAAEEEEEDEDPTSLQQSLPLHPRVARMVPNPTTKETSSFNAYEFFWRTKATTTSSVVNSITNQPLLSLKNYGSNTTMSRNSTGRNGIYYAGGSIVKSCNEPRRCLFFREPNYIAT